MSLAANVAVAQPTGARWVVAANQDQEQPAEGRAPGPALRSRRSPAPRSTWTCTWRSRRTSGATAPAPAAALLRLRSFQRGPDLGGLGEAHFSVVREGLLPVLTSPPGVPRREIGAAQAVVRPGLLTALGYLASQR